MSPATQMIPEGSVIITPFQMYQEQQATHQAVQALTAKVDAITSDLTRRVGELDGPNGELEKMKNRLSSLERWRWITTGAVAMLSSGATVAVYQAISASHH